MPDPRIERAVNRIKASGAASRILISERIVNDLLSDDEVDSVTDLFDDWTPDSFIYKTNDLRKDDGVLYRCLQDHVSQSGWNPSIVPALWTPVRNTTGGNPDPWVQPAGGHDAYHTGDRVKHNEQVWISNIDNNVWEPGVHGWTVE